MEFSYNIRSREEISILDFQGCTMDESSAAGLLSKVDTIVADGHYKIIANLAEVEYINSSGLNVLINILTKCRNKDGELIICNIPEKVKKLLIMSKLISVFETAESEEAAIQKLKKL